MNLRITILLSLSLLLCDLYSQKKSTSDTLNLNEVIITATKTEVSKKTAPISISQISQQSIENSGQTNILPTLSFFVPSIFLTQRNILGFGVGTGSAGSISIRGIGGSPNTGVLVLIDGQPQYQGIFGHPFSDSYVATDISKVEVIRGPGSILYGSNAMSGVINMITKKNKTEGLTGNFCVSYGSYNTQKYYGMIGYKKDKLSIYTSVNREKSDGIRQNTGFEITNGFTKVDYSISKNFNLCTDLNLASLYSSDNGPINLQKQFTADVYRGKTSFSLNNKFENKEGSIKLYHNFGTHDLSDGFYSKDNNSGVTAFENFKLHKKTALTVGLDFMEYGGKANIMAANEYKSVKEFAAYSLLLQEITRKISLNIGLRLENSSSYGNEIVPLAGVNYNPNKNTTIKSSISKGFRNPTIMELYLFVPNPKLRPERLINYEISWWQSLLNSRLNFELTAYKAKGENMIQIVGLYPNISRDNVGKFTNQGIELVANYLHTKQLQFNANYSFLDLSTPIVAAPRHQFNININYQHNRCNLNLSAQHIEKLYTELKTNTETNYTLLNARASIDLRKRFTIFVSMNNILNQKYEINAGYPMPGSNISGGIKYKL